MSVQEIMRKVKDFNQLKKYGLDDEEICELQNLKKESDEKVTEYKVINIDVDMVNRGSTRKLRTVVT